MPDPGPELPLLEHSANVLLSKFGSGEPTPGSGSAAALMGILSAKLILSVCKMSLQKPAYQAKRALFEFHMQEIDEVESRLRDLFERDSKVFATVVTVRKKRDELEGKAKREFREQELELLREAIAIPLEIGQLCLRLIDHAIFAFDAGYQAARGDSGAAVSAAIAGSSSAAFVINMNLRSFGSSNWKSGMRDSVDTLLIQLQEKQVDAFSRVTSLTKTEVQEMELGIGPSLTNAN